MLTIDISVQFRFNIRDFPISIQEIFIIVKDICQEAGRELVKALLKKLEPEAENRLKAQGYTKHSIKERTVSGSLGSISIQLLRMKSPEGKVVYAFKDLVEFPAYKRYTGDVFEASLGLVPYLSYGRSGQESERLMGTGPGKSTIHRQLKQLASQITAAPQRQQKGYRYLMVDGTGATFQEWTHDLKTRVITYPGELRVAWASKGPGCPWKLIGRWTNTEWSVIAQTVFKRIKAEDVQYLISDGGAGIAEAFMRPHMQHQRCTRHALRELKQFLYQDGVKITGQKPIQDKLEALPVFNYTKDTMEQLKEKDRAEVEKTVSDSQHQLYDLVGFVRQKGYPKTATYLENIAQPLLTFLREWLMSGENIPMTSNVAENRFSLIKNRIKRIGKRWSEDGLERWLDITIHKMFPGYRWDKLWSKILKLTGNISCEIIAVY